ncbi:Peptidase family M41 [Candidatus Electrothrix aarhusensis]|uniref:Peptidase family M41 n=1 Tax=Candidatus Electrothrix aarhusensis TaxID=1859131 RepID=A0A444ISH3_9BACT|nr:Peptidase family M41 [Candidatus Electrothrix aarhusensis]
MQLPINEKYTHSKTFLLNNIAILYGGWVAEKVIFGEITTGAGNDIERASELARKMVCEWGMSDELGPLAYGKKEEQIFLGREINQHRDYSEDTARKIDEVVKNIILDATTATTILLEENIDILKTVAEELLDKETITLEDIDRIIQELKDKAEPVAADADAGEESGQESAKVTLEKTADKA